MLIWSQYGELVHEWVKCAMEFGLHCGLKGLVKTIVAAWGYTRGHQRRSIWATDAQEERPWACSLPLTACWVDIVRGLSSGLVCYKVDIEEQLLETWLLIFQFYMVWGFCLTCRKHPSQLGAMVPSCLDPHTDYCSVAHPRWALLGGLTAWTRGHSTCLLGLGGLTSHDFCPETCHFEARKPSPSSVATERAYLL